MWTVWVVALFSAPGVALLLVEPLTFPVALLCFAHAWTVPWLQARKGARAAVALGSERSIAPHPGETGPQQVSLGLLADLVGKDGIDSLKLTGFAPYGGEFGFWLVGEQGALLVRDGVLGKRVFSWCVRVGDADGLPAADRVARLLLALREDEEGFATVANLDFSGAGWRVRHHLRAAQG